LSSHRIHEDALAIDWSDLLSPDECSFVFGNPPFGGSKFQSKAQRAQVRRIAYLGGTGGTLDYVTAWFILNQDCPRSRDRLTPRSRETNVTTQNEQLGRVVNGSFFGRPDLFARDHPAGMEGPPEAWDFARTVIDHGCFLFRKLDPFPSESGLRDLIIQALLRRVLITGEAIRSLLAGGLEEPARATYRTLLELERDLRLVIADSADTSARRLALFLAVKGQRNFAKAARDPTTRDLIQKDAGFFDWFRGRSRSFRHWLDSPGFQDVADELRQADHWHGLAQQEAFEKAGMATEYGFEYGASSIFVHGSNVEHDFADADANGIQFKPLVQRDPAYTLTRLGQATHSLIDIYRLIWEDRGKPVYQESFTVETGNQCFAVDALEVEAIRIFSDPRSQDTT